jgi:VWFA-related protein
MGSSASIILTAALLGQVAADGVETRYVPLSVTDDKGAAVKGLAREDLAVLENGVARDLVSFGLDERPLTVALLVDSSEAVRSTYRIQIVPALEAFVAGLPEGTRVALWTVGERPTKRVDYTDDRKAVSQALPRVVPAGGSTLLDALLEATRDLRKKEGERNAVVVFSATGPEFSSTYRERVVEEALVPDTVFLSVLLEEGATDFENRTNYDFVLDRLARASGGVHGATLSSMAVAKELQARLGALLGQYRLSYATVPDLKERRLEVKVAQPGVRVRVAQPSGTKK